MPLPAKKGLQEIAKQFPKTKEVVIDGKTVLLKPLTLRKVGEIAEIIERVGDEELSIPKLMAKHRNDFADVVRIIAEVESEWFLDLPLDESLKLATEVFHHHYDFLVHHLGPVWAQLSLKVPGIGDGVKSLRISTATASPTPAA